MATQTVDRPEQAAEPQTETIAPAVLVTPEASSLTRDGLLMVVGRRAVAFHDWLFGPALSALERARSAAAMARHDWTNYW
jgi:hypothetical protein